MCKRLNFNWIWVSARVGMGPGGEEAVTTAGTRGRGPEHWPPCQDDGTKPKCADWRLGTPGPRKRAVAAAPREIPNKANFG